MATRKPTTVAMSEEERAMIDRAVRRSDCRSRSEFIRDAAVVSAHRVLEQQDETPQTEGEGDG